MDKSSETYESLPPNLTESESESESESDQDYTAEDNRKMYASSEKIQLDIHHPSGMTLPEKIVINYISMETK